MIKIVLYSSLIILKYIFLCCAITLLNTEFPWSLTISWCSQTCWYLSCLHSGDATVTQVRSEDHTHQHMQCDCLYCNYMCVFIIRDKTSRVASRLTGTSLHSLTHYWVFLWSSGRTKQYNLKCPKILRLNNFYFSFFLWYCYGVIK